MATADTLNSMRKLIVVVGLMALAPACGPGAGGQVVPAHPTHPRVQPPAQITAATYPRHREVYDTLTLGQPGRDGYREAVLDHLVQRGTALLAANKEDRAFAVFLAAVALYDSREVYRKRLSHGGLAGLARRVVTRFSPRGDVRRVMLGLCVAMSLGGESRPLVAEFQRMTTWVSDIEVVQRGRIARGQRVGRMLEQTARSWPSPFVVDELKKNRLMRIKILSRESRIHRHMEVQASYPELVLSGMSIVRAYVRVNQLPEALRQLNALPSPGATFETLRSLLERVNSPTARVGDFLDLARYYKTQAVGWHRPWNSSVALGICRVVRARFPKEAGGHACVGRMARAEDKMLLAQLAMEQAVRLAPKTFTFVDSLADIYRYRSMRLVLRKRTDEATRLLRVTRRFYQRHPKANNRRSEADAHFYYKLGDEFFDEGVIDLSEASLEVSLEVRRGPKAVAKLATIHANRAPSRALKLLDRVQAPVLAGEPDRSSRLFWTARLTSLRARALVRKGEADRGAAAHRAAVIAWQAARKADTSAGGTADAFLNEAKSHFAVGAKGEARKALDGALAIKPLRRGTYLDAIALLASRDRLQSALTAFHRLLKHHGVSEYHLAYCSLWMVTVARRLGQTPDAAAVAFLRKLSSRKWYTRLAALVLGKVTYDKLLAEAGSRAERAELHYYQAELLAAQGKKDAARALYRKVLETEMMGFYEYEMSLHKLRAAQ